MTAFPFPRLTAVVTAIALTVTGFTATPAQAMSEKDRAALGLILGLGALAVIADGNNNHRASRYDDPPPRRQPPRDFYSHDRRRADRCTVEYGWDRHGRRIEIPSPGCYDQPRSHRHDRPRRDDDWRYRD